MMDLLLESTNCQKKRLFLQWLMMIIINKASKEWQLLQIIITTLHKKISRRYFLVDYHFSQSTKTCFLWVWLLSIREVALLWYKRTTSVETVRIRVKRRYSRNSTITQLQGRSFHLMHAKCTAIWSIYTLFVRVGSFTLLINSQRK